MGIIKFISTIFVWTVPLLVACSLSSTKSSGAETTNTDTIYVTSTQQLKSDKIPDSVFQMVNLRHLSISGMDCDYGDHASCWMLKELPKKIKKLQDLITLSLTLSSIQTLPNEVTELKKLRTLDLTDNSALSNIDNIAQIQSLEYLYLYGCGLTKLPDNINNLKNLKEIGLVGNNFDKIEQMKIKKALPNCILKF